MADMNVQPDYSEMGMEMDACPHIRLNSEQVKALGIKVPPRAGATIKFSAVSSVDSVTESDDGGITLCLCVTEINLQGKTIMNALFPDSD